MSSVFKELLCCKFRSHTILEETKVIEVKFIKLISCRIPTAEEAAYGEVRQMYKDQLCLTQLNDETLVAAQRCKQNLYQVL